MNTLNSLVIKPRDTDYVSGVNSPIQFKAVAKGDWTPRIQFFERQRNPNFETDGCACFTAQESFDAQIDEIWPTLPTSLTDQITALGFLNTGLDGKLHFNSSPRFLEIMTGNGTKGNSMQEVWDVMRKYGVVPWKDLPFTDTMTEDEYFSPIPQAVMDKGQKFIDLIGTRSITGKSNAILYHWILNDEVKDLVKMQSALPQAPLCLGVATVPDFGAGRLGWDQTIPTDPPPTDPPAHAVMAYKIEPPNVLIYDHYQPPNKILDAGYPIHYVLQGVVSILIKPPLPPQLPPNPTIPQEISWLDSLKIWIAKVVKIYFPE